MPEYAATRTAPRQGLPPASTGYEVAQVVKGPEPNDPYSPAAAGPSKANDLLQSLGILGKNIVPVALDVGKAVVADRTKEGAQARFVGDALDPNQSNAFIDGYERMDGSYRGVQFGNAAKEYAATNSHLPPDEFQKGLDALQTEYVGKLVHQGQLDTFLPEAVKGGEHATAVYQEAKNAAIIQERNQKVQDIYDGQFMVALNQTALDILKIPLSEGFTSIATNAANRKAYDDNKDAFRAAMSPQIRTILDDARSRYKDLGMTTRDLSASLLGRVGRMAADAGAPGLLDYAYQKNPADGNMSVETAFPDATNKFADQARAMDTQINTAMRLNQERADKKETDQKAGDWLMTLANPKATPEEAKAVFLAVQSETKPMEPDLKWKIGTHAADVMLGQGFALKDNQSVYRDLEMRIGSGKLTGNAAYKVLLDSAHDLAPSSYQHLIEKVFSIENRKGDAVKDHAWANYQREVGAHQASIAKTLGVTDDFGKVMVGLDYSAQVKLRNITSDGISMFFRGLEALKNQHGSEENIPGAEITKLHDRVIGFYRPSVDEVVRRADSNAGYGGETPGTPNSGPKQQKPGIKEKIKATLTRPFSIPNDWIPSGQFSGGKEIYLSPDGKQESNGD